MPPSTYAAVKGVYAKYRTELMNRKYYGRRLAATKQQAKILDIAVAIGTSTAIGTWALWRTAAGQDVWAALSAVAAILAVIKPLLQLPAQTERYTRLFAGHSAAFYSLQALVQEIDRERDYTKAVHVTYLSILGRTKDLSPDDDPSPKKRLVERCFREVKHEIPVSGLWWPPQGESNA